MAKNEIPVNSIKQNTFHLIAHDWALIGAGNEGDFNIMTASWLNMGHMWNKHIISIFIRPQRYTYEFTEKHEYFSVSFFKSHMKHMLKTMGSKSGRDIDKMHFDGLTPKFNETVYFEEAKLTFICKKIYYQDLKAECFIDQSIAHHYPDRDYHRMYMGEIVRVLSDD